MTRIVTIYMPLLDEGINVWRQVTAKRRFSLLPWVEYA